MLQPRRLVLENNTFFLQPKQSVIHSCIKTIPYTWGAYQGNSLGGGTDCAPSWYRKMKTCWNSSIFLLWFTLSLIKSKTSAGKSLSPVFLWIPTHCISPSIHPQLVFCIHDNTLDFCRAATWHISCQCIVEITQLHERCVCLVCCRCSAETGC